MSEELLVQAADAALKLAPPVVVSGLTVLGVSLPLLIQLLTIVYLVVVTAYTLNKWRIERKERRYGSRQKAKQELSD